MLIKNRSSLDAPKLVIRTTTFFPPCHLNVHLVRSWAHQLSLEWTSWISRSPRKAVNNSNMSGQILFGCKQQKAQLTYLSHPVRKSGDPGLIKLPLCMLLLGSPQCLGLFLVLHHDAKMATAALGFISTFQGERGKQPMECVSHVYPFENISQKTASHWQKVFLKVSGSCKRALRNSISKAKEKGIASGFQRVIPWNPP